MRYDYITESGKTITQDTRDAWPTRAFTATGQGVTVHKSTGRLFVATGEDEIVPLVRRTAPVRNIIEAAAVATISSSPCGRSPTRWSWNGCGSPRRT